jgi:hypothetical protein
MEETIQTKHLPSFFQTTDPKTEQLRQDYKEKKNTNKINNHRRNKDLNQTPKDSFEVEFFFLFKNL